MEGRTSVIIPFFNYHHFIEKTLESVRGQTRSALEIIVVDDGSVVPLRRPANWDGPPLHIVRTENRGLSAARNTGVGRARGEFVAFLDADDLWLPNKIERQEDRLTAQPQAVACFTRCTAEPGFFSFGPYPPEDIDDNEMLLMLWYHNFFPPSAVLARREVVQRVGGFSEALTDSMDIELWLRLLVHGLIVQVSEPLCRYRRHEGQLSTNTAHKLAQGRAARRLMIAQHPDRLIRAGVPRERLWDAYRNDVLLTFYRREFAGARHLLWQFWLEHPTDWRVLAYAMTALLPARLVERWRGRLPLPSEPPATPAAPERWTNALAAVRRSLAVQGV
jgi:glycosyltransferase involved in cell wall biosynthesis